MAQKKTLGTIFNNDINNILGASSGANMTPEEYQRAVYAILDMQPGALAQDVGQPDAVIYRTSVATTFDKYHAWVWLMVQKKLKEEHLVTPEALNRQGAALRKLFASGTDPLTLTIEACRKRGVLILASYRMNAEDFYEFTTMMEDFGRAHPDWKIPGANCLDPAVPEVYAHRMNIFREVAERYDIDGIEFDFRRWYHMVSDPLKNHIVLTRMVRETRQMLDEVAQKKGRQKLILGVRVGPLLEGKFVKSDFPGAYYGEPTNRSCKNIGLDVKKWIDERLVDYVCPTLFSPMGLPRTKEFVELAKGSETGVYPTISCVPGWAHDSVANRPDDSEAARRRYRDDICKEALQCYAEGADGISLFNWFPHHFPPPGESQFSSGHGAERKWPATFGPGALGFGWVQQELMPKLSDPKALREMLKNTDQSNAQWQPHAIRQLNGAAVEIRIPAKLQIVTESWSRVVAVPYLVYMPEKERLLMLVGCDYPHQAMVMSSDDRGATWTKPKYLHVDAKGKSDTGLCTGLTYLGQGKVVAFGSDRRWFSRDYGASWSDLSPLGPTPDGKPWYVWDPMLVERNAQTGVVTRLTETGYTVSSPGHQRGYLRFSADEGRTWSDGVRVPQWKGVDEVVLLRAQNGDLVAACRTDIPARIKDTIDHYEGLGVSISKDRGATWSEVKKLYDWGRHHPSLLLMPNHDIVMTYVVRKGYVDTPDGFPQFGIEAVVSHDHGQTWDLDHRYLLHTWAGNRKGSNEDRPGPQAHWASSQATSSVLLPDGAILTAFGTGYRSQPDRNNLPAPRDVGLVLWQLGGRPLDDDRTIRDAPFDSDVRNVVDPATGKDGMAIDGKKF